MDLNHLRQWIGKRQEAEDVVTPRVANALAAILDQPPDLKDGDEAPVGIHWCLAPEIAPMHLLGEDGHPRRGGFLPPVPLPRRMWAGGALDRFGAFRIGATIRRSSRVADVTVKAGSHGELCFVTVVHDYHDAAELVLRERQDIVYRDAPGRTAASAADRADAGDRCHHVEGSPVLLQRYSAATLNGHRIHYDRDYCRDVEGYPALVVHGPLQATFLLSMATALGQSETPPRFSYRSVRPLFDGGTFSVNGSRSGGQANLWIADRDGAKTMSAEAVWTEA